LLLAVVQRILVDVRERREPDERHVLGGGRLGVGHAAATAAHRGGWRWRGRLGLRNSSVTLASRHTIVVFAQAHTSSQAKPPPNSLGTRNR